MAEPAAPAELTRGALAAVVACVVGNFLCSAPIVTTTVGAFLIPVTREFGWSRAAFSFVLSIVAVIGVVAFPLAGHLADRLGVRRVVLVGNLLFAASVAALGTTRHGLVNFYLLYALVAVTSAFSASVLLSRVIASWFVRRRGLFLGLTAGIGNGIGCAVMPVLTLVVIGHYGWRAAYYALGALVALGGFPVLWALLREKPATPDGTGAAAPVVAGLPVSAVRRDPLFWALAAAVALGAGTITAVFTHVVPILLDRGFSIETASLTVTGLACGSTVWQISFGRILDSLKTPRAAAPAILLALLGMFLLVRGHSNGSLAAAGVLIGMGSGTEFAMLPYAITRYFGLRCYNEIYGAIFGFVMLATGFTPIVMDLFYDRFHNYDLALLVIGGALVVTTTIIARLPHYRFSGGSSEPAPAPLSADPLVLTA